MLLGSMNCSINDTLKMIYHTPALVLFLYVVLWI